MDYIDLSYINISEYQFGLIVHHRLRLCGQVPYRQNRSHTPLDRNHSLPRYASSTPISGQLVSNAFTMAIAPPPVQIVRKSSLLRRCISLLYGKAGPGLEWLICAQDGGRDDLIVTQLDFDPRPSRIHAYIQL